MSEESLNTAAESNTQGSKADELIRQVEFGSYLRDARLALGLTTLDVADRLKLNEDIIKALENSRVDVLPVAAFTQGYIKAYAKLLKISPDEIMRAYDQMVPNKVVSLNVTSGVPAQRSSRDSMVKTTSYVLVVLALILVAFWIQQSGFELSGNFVPQAQEESAVTTEQPVEETTQPDPYPADMLSGDPVAMMDSMATDPAKSPAPSVVVPEKKSVVAEKNVPETKTEIKPLQKPAVVPEAKPASAALVKPEQRMVMVSNGGDVIHLTASAESWAEVQDADNNRLYYSLMKAGDAHAIKGRAPFKVFLGNAPSVAVNVNNQPVDISRYIRQNSIAHVKISSAATTQMGGPRSTVNQVIDQFVPETPATARTE